MYYQKNYRTRGIIYRSAAANAVHLSMLWHSSSIALVRLYCNGSSAINIGFWWLMVLVLYVIWSCIYSLTYHTCSITIINSIYFNSSDMLYCGVGPLHEDQQLVIPRVVDYPKWTELRPGQSRNKPEPEPEPERSAAYQSDIRASTRIIAECRVSAVAPRQKSS